MADRRLWVMGGMGFACGLPLPLSGFTLGQWMSESGVSLGAIGLSATIGLSYSLKFLWSPVLDRIAPPGPLRRLGRRRGWLLAIQPALAAACALLALSDPSRAPAVAVGIAGAIAFLSASQDIVVDAWRIESFSARLQGAALAFYVWGYRLALLVANAGAIRLASWLGWHGSLLAVAGLSCTGMVSTLCAAEPVVATRAMAVDLRAGFSRAVVDPLREFLRRPRAGPVLGFVLLFNLGEALAGVMLPPYYRALGYGRNDVALANLPALAASLLGIALGGGLVARLGAGRALVLTGFVQMLAILIYVGLGYAGGDPLALVGTVATEAFVGGLASAAFLAYLSGLCAPAYTATQYALLSSLAVVPLRTLAGISGFLAAAVGWRAFYLLCTLSALPAMLIMVSLLRKQRRGLCPRPAGGSGPQTP